MIGFVYLTSIMDLFSRKIIAWVLSTTLEAQHVVDCVNLAKQKRHVDKPLVFHNDRGSQYVSDAFKDATASFINSYSQKGYPWDNACIESFHALIKREWINRFALLEYIEAFYNTVRLHSHCDYRSPDQYEEQYLEKLEESLKPVS